MKSRIVQVCKYDSDWPSLFLKEKELLSVVLGKIALNIWHIGSTSVVGLSAKPIIDILVEATDVNLLEGCNKAMQDLSYKVKGEFGIPGRRYFSKGGNHKTHHVHIYGKGDHHLCRHLAFRDYLVAHPDVRMQYGTLKEKVAENCGNDINKYMDGKNDFIQHYEKLAVAWYDA